jgi:hypothetical protein
MQKTGFFTKAQYFAVLFYKVHGSLTTLCRWFRFAQLAKGKKSRP